MAFKVELWKGGNKALKNNLYGLEAWILLFRNLIFYFNKFETYAPVPPKD